MANYLHDLNSYIHEKHATRYVIYYFFLLSFLIFGLPYLMYIFQLNLVVLRVYLILVLLSSIFLTKKGLIKNLLLILATITITLFIHHDNPDIFLQSIRNLCLAVFLITVLYKVIQDVLTSEISPRILFQALNGYLLLGLLFSELLKLVHLHDPASFNFDPLHQYNHLYLSFTLISSVGLGDLVPLTYAAKSLVIFISVVGQMYNLFFASVIIGKYVGTSMKEKQDA